MRLNKKYPKTIVTTERYLKTLDVPHSCAPATLRIDADGMLHYPCHMCVQTMIDASKDSIMDFLRSKEAMECRQKMRSCDVNCHVYAYFAMESALSLRGTFSAMMQYVQPSST
jgi:hypothetical protein